MKPDLSVRPDNRLADMPMVPVACRKCEAQVLVRKSTWNQTSVQWTAAASTRCVQRREADKIAGHGVFLACSALGESILAAVATGELAIVDSG
ncbi:MAG: ferredoxin [Mycobacterium sp.]|nr:MAG: ferredoxin [Mycobacterium sp.]